MSSNTDEHPPRSSAPQQPRTAPPAPIVVDDLSGREIAALLAEHLAEMHAISPACSVRLLDLDALRGPDITILERLGRRRSARRCGALKPLHQTTLRPPAHSHTDGAPTE